MALLCWGLGFYGHGFYLAELRRQHGWSTALISSASTASYLLSAVLVIFISDAIWRFGVRACVLTGSAAFAAAAAALPCITEPWQLFAVYLVMALGWTNMSVGAITNIVGLWFEHKRGLAISLALNGASFSGVIVVPFLVLITEAHGFATAMLVSALIIVGLIVPLLALIRPASGRRTRARPLPGLAAPPSEAWRSGACLPLLRWRSFRRPAFLCTRSHSWSRRSVATRPVSPSPSPPPWRFRSSDARCIRRSHRPAHRQRFLPHQPGGGVGGDGELN